MADGIVGRISVGDGATFTPSVSDGGVLSWENNKNLPNPDDVDLAQAVIDRGGLAPINSPAFTGSDDMFQDEDYYGKTIWDGEQFISPDQWAMSAVV